MNEYPVNEQCLATWLDWRLVDHVKRDAVQVLLLFLDRNWIVDQSELCFDDRLTRKVFK
ncbi:hypothetical protein [Cohaesibacter gelatinilyticus]|uniref:hypothetical protein n=1 Tax=Cohaesibacter gelatinilyticus TaxID=372072 RepID=UPI001AECC00C|nr:hypothetical protein [Cohaesibacter gelatinilyticus]